jgi:hypothetical protein
MARAPTEPPPPPVPPPPRLLRLRVTEPEADVIVRALRTTSTSEAQRLADVLDAEAALLRRAPTRSR